MITSTNRDRSNTSKFPLKFQQHLVQSVSVYGTLETLNTRAWKFNNNKGISELGKYFVWLMWQQFVKTLEGVNSEGTNSRAQGKFKKTWIAFGCISRVFVGEKE